MSSHKDSYVRNTGRAVCAQTGERSAMRTRRGMLWHCRLGIHRWIRLGDDAWFCDRCGARRWRTVLRPGESARIPLEEG